jgi:hypothetical protein
MEVAGTSDIFATFVLNYERWTKPARTVAGVLLQGLTLRIFLFVKKRQTFSCS